MFGNHFSYGQRYELAAGLYLPGALNVTIDNTENVTNYMCPKGKKTDFQTWSPSKDSDKPVLSSNLIIIFTMRILDRQMV